MELLVDKIRNNYFYGISSTDICSINLNGILWKITFREKFLKCGIGLTFCDLAWSFDALSVVDADMFLLKK